MDSILLVEDDEQLREVTSAFLEMSGYNVQIASNAFECWSKLNTVKFDLIILDLGLPDEDGLVLLRKITSKNIKVPIIICSGRDTDDDRIAGLEFGASDYLAKPFRVKELLLRIKLLIEGNSSTPSVQFIQLGDKRLDVENKILMDQNNCEIELTSHEQAVLYLLAENAPRAYTREEIIDATNIAEGPESIRSVDTTICRLRKKIEKTPKTPKAIKTVHGIGYRITHSLNNTE